MHCIFTSNTFVNLTIDIEIDARHSSMLTTAIFVFRIIFFISSNVNDLRKTKMKRNSRIKSCAAFWRNG